MSLRKISPAARGFTLIELLTVIAIIAILMGLLFPAIMGAKDSARNAKAETDIKGIVAAIAQYKLDYGSLPDTADPAAAPPAAGTDTLLGDPLASIQGSPNSALFNTLRAIPAGPNINDAQNKRHTIFIDGRQVSNTTMPKDGFLDAAGAPATTLGCYFDPWGTQYNIVLDTSGDHQLDVSSQYTDFTAPSAPRAEIGAFSIGKDKRPGKNGDKLFKSGTTKSDDIVSWQ